MKTTQVDHNELAKLLKDLLLETHLASLPTIQVTFDPITMTAEYLDQVCSQIEQKG